MTDEDLPAVPGGWTLREFSAGGLTLTLRMPANPDAFLDDPAVLEANRLTDYMPYWCHLWPTAVDAMAIIGAADTLPSGPALELGAGLGLAGLAAAKRGVSVVCSDYDALSVRVCLHNAELNGLQQRVQATVLDWRSPTTESFRWIIGCDVIYERRNHPALIGVLNSMLSPDGEAWFVDPERHQAADFEVAARGAGYVVKKTTFARQPFPGRTPGPVHLWRVWRESR